jgi:hypothetical protein
MDCLKKTDIKRIATFHGDDLPLGIDIDNVVFVSRLREVFSDRAEMFHEGKWCYLIPKEDIAVVLEEK